MAEEMNNITEQLQKELAQRQKALEEAQAALESTKQAIKENAKKLVKAVEEVRSGKDLDKNWKADIEADYNERNKK